MNHVFMSIASILATKLVSISLYKTTIEILAKKIGSGAEGQAVNTDQSLFFY